VSVEYGIWDDESNNLVGDGIETFAEAARDCRHINSQRISRERGVFIFEYEPEVIAPPPPDPLGYP
jgi:hypothetical protein